MVHPRKFNTNCPWKWMFGRQEFTFLGRRAVKLRGCIGSSSLPTSNLKHRHDHKTPPPLPPVRRRSSCQKWAPKGSVETFFLATVDLLDLQILGCGFWRCVKQDPNTPWNKQQKMQKLLNMDAWNMNFPFGIRPIFRVKYPAVRVSDPKFLDPIFSRGLGSQQNTRP